MRQVFDLDRTMKLDKISDLIVLQEQMTILNCKYIHKRFGKCIIQRMAIVMAATSTILAHFAASW